MRQLTKNVYLYVAIIFPIFLAVSVHLTGWTETWKKLKIPTLYPSFADLRTIQAAPISFLNGYNPQIFNPFDPWQRPMNYPSIWIKIANFLDLTQEVNFIIFAISFAAMYFICVTWLIAKFPSVFGLIFALSWAPLLAIERGNTDVLIFALACLISYSSVVLRLTTFLVSVTLKLYPVLILFIIELPRKYFVSAVICLIFIFTSFGTELRYILNGNSATGVLSYGFQNSFQELINFVKINQIIWFEPNLFTFLLLSITILILTFCVKYLILLTRAIVIQLNSNNILENRLFMIGSTIYCGTFLLTTNWDYRLIFLILCYPLLIALKKTIFKYYMLFMILIALNQGLVLEIKNNLLIQIILLGNEFILFVTLIPVTLYWTSKTFLKSSF